MAQILEERRIRYKHITYVLTVYALPSAPSPRYIITGKNFKRRAGGIVSINELPAPVRNAFAAVLRRHSLI